MTRMLASVRSVEEARMMLEAGADIIDLKEPSDGVLGALPPEIVRDIVSEVRGRIPVSATIGDIGGDPERVRAAVTRLAKAGVDIVKVGLFKSSGARVLLQTLREFAQGGVRIVLVIFAEDNDFLLDADEVAAHGLAGVMVDTRDKQSGSLLHKVPLDVLAQFVEKLRSAGLVAGLAGALRAEDVADLLPLRADYLGFRGALCKGDERIQRICIRRAQIIRSLIPGPADAPVFARTSS